MPKDVWPLSPNKAVALVRGPVLAPALETFEEEAHNTSVGATEQSQRKLYVELRCLAHGSMVKDLGTCRRTGSSVAHARRKRIFERRNLIRPMIGNIIYIAAGWEMR